MLRQLDGELDRLAHLGWQLAVRSIDHAYVVALVVSAALAAAFWNASRESRRIALALGAATWAQVALFSDRIGAAVILYATAVLTAYSAGRSTEPIARPSTPWWVDLIAVSILVALASLLRLYALEAIPWFVDVEPAGAFLESLSSSGLSHYITHNRVLDDGFVHMPVRWLANSLFGPSILTLRIASVSLGVLSVALCYAAARQFVGPAWAFAAGSLLATDPVHLYWSRIEASQIVAATTTGFATLIITAWLAKGWSSSAAVAAMLWMPLTRYFYAAGLALAALPVLALFTTSSSMRKQAFRAIPLLLVGSILWFHSSTLLRFAATGEWQPVSTLSVYGRSILELHDPHNEHTRNTAIERAELQARRVADNASRLIAHLAYHRESFSNWLMLAQPDFHHRRSVSAAVFAILIPAIGYLLGAGRGNQRSVLLLWLFVLTLPALFSEDPEPRRAAGFMAGVYLPVVVLLSDATRVLRRTPAISGVVATAAIVSFLGAVAFANAACHFRGDRADTAMAQYAELAARAFHEADTIFHNIEDEAAAGMLVYANAGEFTRRLPCIRYVTDWNAEWTAVTTEPSCSFDSPIYDYVLTRESVQRTNIHAPSSVAYLLEIDSRSEADVFRRLRQRFPSARVEHKRLILPPRGPQDLVLLVTTPKRPSGRR